ncbi:FtsW/RodA/SpoVE family cell cycle protein, partial [Bifidobacterium pseudocatenulatum]|nr:FtsW/RodA/SpoVE family cell cycle protein [Bifidobacterium pseudocatenulatum]
VTFQNNLKKRVLKDDFRLIGLLILETIPVAILSVFQKDFGTFLVFAAIFAGIILVAGISWKILAPAFLFVA